MKTYVVTGGGGFIGSNIASALNDAYPDSRIVVSDVFGSEEKWRNLSKHPVDEIISPRELLYWLEAQADTIEAVIHMGAISSTTERNADLILENNVSYSRVLWAWCTAHEKRFIYASSGSVYGDGSDGFKDDLSLPYQKKLKPLNAYAWSKWLFDYFVGRTLHLGEPQPPQWAGLRFFNVYGPNEYHKGEQQSVISRIFPHAQAQRPVKLFHSYHPDYADGGQQRDFIYVKDCVSVVLWLLANPGISGLYNVGTGQARSFEDLAKAVFSSIGKPTQISYIDMPPEIRDKYQYHTEADMAHIRDAGYNLPFHSLEEGVADYVHKYLIKDDPYL